MSERTYNTGRVVGWSSYEEFLKETGISPSDISNYVYQTLVTYGVTKIVELSYNGWVASQGGRFYSQTVRVKGASWGAVPIVGVDYEDYLSIWSNPQHTDSHLEQNDEIYKTSIEEAIGNVFGVYVSDADGKKATSSVSTAGYLTFMAYPDVLNFYEDVDNLPGNTLKLIVRGLSMEDLDIEDLYFGPQGFVFAGNGLIPECYHLTQNINNLMLTASSYLTFAVTGSAASSGGAYKQYDNISIQLEGTVTGYLDTDRLDAEGYLMTNSELVDYLAAASNAGVSVTTAAYDVLTDKNDYLYMIYGYNEVYTSNPSGSNPLYVLCIHKDDGYTGLGAQLDYSNQAEVGYDSSNPEITVSRRLSLLYNTGTAGNQVLLLKDKPMPDYIGAYWGKDNGWNGYVSYSEQNSLTQLEWSTLKQNYNAVHTDAGRNSYITLTPGEAHSPIYQGAFIKVYGDVDAGEDGDAIRGIYVCTSSCDNDSNLSTIQLSRRGGYLKTTIESSAVRVSAPYTRLPQWTFSLYTPSGSDPYLTAGNSDYSCRIYQNELIWVEQPASSSAYSKIEAEWQVVNIVTSGSPDLIVCENPAILLSDASSDVANYSGSLVDSSYTNAIQRSSISDLLPTTINVHANPFSDTTSTYTITRGGNADHLTIGTLVELEHTVSDVFGENESYWYQYIGTDNNTVVLASSTSQKDGTNFYSIAKLTSHLNSGFPRSKKPLPIGGSYYYNYPRTVSKIPVAEFFDDFGLDIDEFLHPDFRNTSMLRFLQNLLIYKHLGKGASLANKRNIGYSKKYPFFTKAVAEGIVTTEPTPSSPASATLRLSAKTDSTSFTSPGFFTAQYINSSESTEPFSLANPEYPIWATVAKSRNGSETMSVSLIDDEGGRLDISGSDGFIEADTITLQDILVGLATGKSIDILSGVRFHKNDAGVVYIILPDDLRIYLSATEPVSTLDEPIPDGSVGIGWSPANTIKVYSSGSWS